MSSALKVGVVGAGVMGSGHIEYLSQHVAGVQVAAVAEPDKELRDEVLARWGLSCPGFDSLVEMLDSVDLDGVVVASPDRFHAESIKLLLARQMPALCEKPLAQTIEDATELLERSRLSAEELGRPLIHLGFMRRFDPPLVQVKQIINSGELGPVLYVNASTRNVASPGISSDELLTNIAVHEVDTLRWLLSDEWDHISVLAGRSTSVAPAGTRDPIVITGLTRDGVAIVADIFANNSYGYDVRCEITCESGVVSVGVWGEVQVVKNHEQPGRSSVTLGDNWIPRYRDAYIAELVAWTGTLRGEPAPDLATVQDGFHAMEVLDRVLST